MRIKLPSAVRAFRARGIQPDEIHEVTQGTLNLWLFSSVYIGELVIGESEKTPGAIFMTSAGGYINTTPPQEIADDIYEWNQGDDTVRQLSASGAILGSITSDAKATAARENGKRGGRPRKSQ